jgi:superfamily I DNA/RNA helicase
MELDENGEQKYNYSDIAICARTKDALKDFRNALHKNDIPYTEKDSDKKNLDKSVSLLTFHKVKGLEFKHVILIDVNSRSIPKLPFDFDSYDEEGKENYLRKEKSLIYVAITRAIENVMITGIGNASDVIKVG